MSGIHLEFQRPALGPLVKPGLKALVGEPRVELGEALRYVGPKLYDLQMHIRLLTRKLRYYPTNKLFPDHNYLRYPILTSIVGSYYISGSIRSLHSPLSAVENIIKHPALVQLCMLTMLLHIISPFYTTHHRNIQGKMLLNNHTAIIILPYANKSYQLIWLRLKNLI